MLLDEKQLQEIKDRVSNCSWMLRVFYPNIPYDQDARQIVMHDVPALLAYIQELQAEAPSPMYPLPYCEACRFSNTTDPRCRCRLSGEFFHPVRPASCDGFIPKMKTGAQTP